MSLPWGMTFVKVMCLMPTGFSDGSSYGLLPPGQFLTEKFPVLTYGSTPHLDLDTWRLEVRGSVNVPVRLTWNQLRSMRTVHVRSDFHCVTRWSRLSNLWEGVRVRDLLGITQPQLEATFVMAHCYGGYTTNLPLEAVLEGDAIIAFRHDGTDLSPDHGWPARLVVPGCYGWKSAKWLSVLEILAADHLGFWELHGYHSKADPWLEERFSS